MLPTFSMSGCLSYFTNILAKINPNKVFNIPSWIPLLPDPTIEFNLDPPTYQQITDMIRKVKTSGSPCPLDQVSIICFKRYPFLRSYLTELIRAVWLSGSIPDEWKKACTIHVQHAAQMAYIINQARIKQRSLVIALLDLKNALGEINHNLIHSVLGYHHIPDHIKILIKSPYTDFKTSIITSSFNTPFNCWPGSIAGRLLKSFVIQPLC